MKIKFKKGGKMHIPDKVTIQMKLLNLSTYPFSQKELSDSFRLEIMRYHPDKYKKDDANEKASKIIEAYNELKLYANDDELVKVTKEKSMFDFTETCEYCNGKGFSFQEVRIKGYDCLKCKDTGYFSVKCNKCNNGKFTLRSGRQVDCKACNGTGIYKMKCNHRLTLSQEFWYTFRDKNEYIQKKVKCSMCNGTGRVSYEPINPVIPKGAILR
jgi:hypothetical protein